MPLNFNHFYYFYEVAKYGSFTAAARALLVSQSSLSIQVKQFEEGLGSALFDRRKGGVDLTESGNAAFQVADRVFQDIEGMVAHIKESKQRITGRVSIGTVNSIGIYTLPELLSRFKADFPDALVKIDFKEAVGVVDQLYAGKIDFALIPWNRKYSDLTGIELTKTKMFWIAPKNHPLAKAGAVSPRELEAHPIVGYGEGMYTRTMMDALFKRLSMSVEYSIESSNAATIKHMVMAGMGLGLLPEDAVSAEIRQGQLARLDVSAMTMTQEIMLYYKSNRALSPTREQFMDFLIAYFNPKHVRDKR